MNKRHKLGAHPAFNLEFVFETYLIVCVVSTSGLDVLLMVTLFLLGLMTLRHLITGVRTQESGVRISAAPHARMEGHKAPLLTFDVPASTFGSSASFD